MTPEEPAPGRGLPRELGRDEIDAFLREQRVARLGCRDGDEVYVVPVIYGYDGESIAAVTTEGRKVSLLRANPRVCVEVDEYDADGRGSWRSVIAQGDYEELTGDEIEPALDLLRERFTRAAGRAPERRALGPGVVVFRVRLHVTTGRAVER
jgi:nitroimidazol reductase NimA-like FMN-containing flavoprotein (pyridoxamine 5'-phosphate oxidase superfamily)